jgi:hypothetical protein
MMIVNQATLPYNSIISGSFRMMTVSRKVRAKEYTTGTNIPIPNKNQNHLTVVTTETDAIYPDMIIKTGKGEND